MFIHVETQYLAYAFDLRPQEISIASADADANEAAPAGAEHDSMSPLPAAGKQVMLCAVRLQVAMEVL